jgi:hypothetical protein
MRTKQEHKLKMHFFSVPMAVRATEIAKGMGVGIRARSER